MDGHKRGRGHGAQNTRCTNAAEARTCSSGSAVTASRASISISVGPRCSLGRDNLENRASVRLCGSYWEPLKTAGQPCDENLAPQRRLGSLERSTQRPLKHSHLKKHTAVARATAGKVLASRCASQGQSTRRGLSCQAWYAFTTTRPHRVTEALAELPGGTRQWRAQPWSCMDAAPGCRLQRRPSANILLTAWPGRVAQAPRAGRARAPWSCSKPCWRPSSRTARFRDQLQLSATKQTR